MHQKVKCFICIALMLALTLCIPAATASAQGRIGYVVETALPVYAGPHQAARVLGYMAYGEALWVRAWKNGWAQVLNRSGNMGYCLLSGLSGDDPNTFNINAYVKSGGATVYAKPSTDYSVRIRVPAGACFKAVSMTRDGKWVRLKNGSLYGYALASELSTKPTTCTIWIVSDGAVAVMADSNAWGATVGTVSHGQSYELLAIQGDRAQIRNASGKTGWVPKSVISYTDPNDMDFTAYAQVSGKLLWPNSILSGSAVSVKAGTPVQVVSLSEDGSWYHVKYNGKYYYALGYLFNNKAAPEGGRILYCGTDSCEVHAEPSFTSKNLATLTLGEAVQLIGVSDGGGALRIRTKSGVVGYVPPGSWMTDDGCNLFGD